MAVIYFVSSPMCVITVYMFRSGPWVWYQRFEYAAAHWIQKTTEHVLGSVLCSPGCFSIVRASRLMADGVVKAFTKMPTEARHFLQYDQGKMTLQWCHMTSQITGNRAVYSTERWDRQQRKHTKYEFWNNRRSLINIVIMCYELHQVPPIFSVILTSQLFMLLNRLLSQAKIAGCVRYSCNRASPSSTALKVT